MKVVPFTDQYESVAPLYGTTPSELQGRDERRGHPRRWIALDGREPIGAATTTSRPDRRTFVHLVGEGYGALTDALAHRTLYTFVDADDHAAVRALRDAGFEEEVVEERFRIRFDRALAGLRRARLPAGYRLRPADAVDEGRLFVLDNTLRQDVPGTDGWRGNRDWFRAELADSPPFDPAAYLVAVDDDNGEYVGLVRIWRNPSGPRFGLVGVLRQYRGTPIAAALMKPALAAASRWGHETFVTETSLSNRVIYRRMERLGAESLGRFMQMVRR